MRIRANEGIPPHDQPNLSRLPEDIINAYKKILNNMSKGIPQSPKDWSIIDARCLQDANAELSAFIEQISNDKNLSQDTKNKLLEKVKGLKEEVSKLTELTVSFNKLESDLYKLWVEEQEYNRKGQQIPPELKERVSQINKDMKKIENERSAVDLNNIWDLDKRIQIILYYR